PDAPSRSLANAEASALLSATPALGSRVGVSCFIRACNEERLIADVIRAAERAADEVIVIDSGSADRTVEIAKAAGARVICVPWQGFGKQKRIGEEIAANNWLLDLDADEIVSPELASEIRALFALGEPSLPVYQITLVTTPLIGGPWWRAAIAKRNR